MGYSVIYQHVHSMHLSAKSLVAIILACSLFVSACGIRPRKPASPDSPQSTIAIIVLKNVDPKAKPARLIDMIPVTFENRDDAARYSKDYFLSQCFGGLERVCVRFNVLPGRYHVGGFYAGKTTFYSLQGELSYEGSSFGNPVRNFHPDDFYFVLPRSEAHFLGSFLWSNNADGTLFKESTFGLVPDKNGTSERTALLILLRDEEFQKNYTQWVPEVQERLAKLSQPATAPVVAAPPPAVVKPVPSLKKSSRKK